MGGYFPNAMCFLVLSFDQGHEDMSQKLLETTHIPSFQQPMCQFLCQRAFSGARNFPHTNPQN